MSIDLLKKELKENKCGRIYLLCGTEEYTKDHYATEIRKKVLSLPLPEFNYIRLKGKDFSVPALTDCLESLPYMSEQKLIEVNEFDFNKLNDSMAEELCSVLEDTPEYANVLFVVRENEISSKAIQDKEKSSAARVLQTIRKKGLVVEFKSESEAKLLAWIKKHFTARKTKIEDRAAEELLLICGEDMYMLLGEIEKLSAYCKDRTVSVEDVKTVCCINQSFQIFDLTKALTDRDFAVLHNILHKLLDAGQPAQLIIGALSKCLSDMIIIKAGVEDSIAISEIASKLKSFDWAVRRYLPAVRKASFDYLEYAAKECSACEKKLKSFSSDEKTELELFMIKLACFKG